MGIYKLLANQPVVKCLHFSQGQLNPVGRVSWEMLAAKFRVWRSCSRAEPSERQQRCCGITKHRADNTAGPRERDGSFVTSRAWGTGTRL